jgi:hypothetical protein
MSRRICAAPLAFAAAVLISVLAAPGASAATCTGSPHDADSSAAIDVSCDTAINSGSFEIAVNRGTDPSIPNPKVANGSGSFSCVSAPQPNGSQFDAKVTCSGSMSAGATATVLTSFGPNACSKPAFVGQLTVAFGDGSTFGPSPLASYPCNGGGGNPSQCDKVRTGRDCDPGGIFLRDVKRPPRKATVAAAHHGLKFKLKLGVKGKAITTIEVGGKVVGKTTRSVKSGKVAKLVAKLSGKWARKLAGKHKRALIHVEVKPNAAAEGFSTHGREYFKLKLTG